MMTESKIKVMIGIPTAEFARQAVFYDCLAMLQRPEGTLTTLAHGQSPARNRNEIIASALEHGCSHIFFLDDDIKVRPDTLMRLLAHNKDIVTGLYLMRQHPHQPIIFDLVESDGKCLWSDLTNKTGLVKVVAAGLGCVLIKTSIFEKLEKPYIRLGELELDQWCDDIGFFNRVRAAGIDEIYCDLDATAGHMATATVWPVFDKDTKIHGAAYEI